MRLKIYLFGLAVLAVVMMPVAARAQSCWGKMGDASVLSCSCSPICRWRRNCCDDYSALTHAAEQGCDRNSDCDERGGEVCGVNMGQYFGDGSPLLGRSVCVPSSCTDLAYQCAHCGDLTSPCGVCPPAEACDPDVRVIPMRVWNLVADDGSGQTGFDEETSSRRLDVPESESEFPYLTAD